MELWRPVGTNELALIEKANFLAFPPRLPEQPIFYPVLSFGYAEKIARDWNSKQADHKYLGFVTYFEIDDQYASRFPAQIAGGKACQELWVPADELVTFNQHLIHPIKLVATYRNGERVIDPA
jgi:hypothetical protein